MADLFDPMPARHALHSFKQYSGISEVANDVIYGAAIEDAGLTVRIKLGSSRSNRSWDIIISAHFVRTTTAKQKKMFFRHPEQTINSICDNYLNGMFENQARRFQLVSGLPETD